MIELELLALVWGLKKCRIFVQGLQHFTVVVDHRPLLPILNDYTMDAIDNPRLQRLKEKTSLYNFTAIWRKGKDHAIPDALSRAPVDQPTQEDDLLIQVVEHHVHQASIRAIGEVCQRTPPHLQDPRLDDITSAAKDDAEYQLLLTAVTRGFPPDKKRLDHRLLPFWSVRHDLSAHDGLILKGCRILIPRMARRNVLQALHDAHQGIETSRQRARQTIWWPGITSDIANTIGSCQDCQERRPSLPQEPITSDPLHSRVFEDVSSDIFSYAGKEFLVVDRLSGWASIHQLPRGDSTSRQVIRIFRGAFVSLGVPVWLRTDGGPKYKSHEFAAFLKRWGVRHDQSSP